MVHWYLIVRGQSGNYFLMQRDSIYDDDVVVKDLGVISSEEANRIFNEGAWH